jgi:hypothetical protein
VGRIPDECHCGHRDGPKVISLDYFQKPKSNQSGLLSKLVKKQEEKEEKCKKKYIIY